MLGIEMAYMAGVAWINALYTASDQLLPSESDNPTTTSAVGVMVTLVVAI